MTRKPSLSNKSYERFVKRWEEVTELPPQTLGPLTPQYKALVKRLKVMPWPMLVVLGVITVAVIYLIVGQAVTFLVSLLQKGF